MSPFDDIHNIRIPNSISSSGVRMKDIICINYCLKSVRGHATCIGSHTGVVAMMHAAFGTEKAYILK
jgi:hypothetical protein